MSAEADVVVVEEDQESGSEEVCDICRDETSTPEHPIVFCDGVDCKVAVHQECYGIAELPSGPWKCDCCSMGLQPATTPCLLCPNFGGAMKRVLNELPDGKIVLTNDWCHAFCATLINETFIQGFEGGEAVFGVSLALKQRSKLKCVVCNVKQGACAQCLSDRCAVAIHPTCALNAGLPISTKGDKHFGFLCTRHARAPAPAAAPGASPSGGDGEPATTDADVTPATAKRVITPSTSVVSTGRPPSRPKTTSKAEPSSASKPRGRPKSQNKVSKPKPVIDSEEEGLDDFDAPDDTPALTTSNRLWPILEPIFFGKQKDAAWKLLEESQIPSPYSSPKALSPAVHTVAVQQTVSASQQADMGVMPMATDTTDAPSTIPEPLVTVASTDGPALPFGQAADVPLLPVEQTVKVSALPVEPAVEPIAEQPADVATVQVEAPPQPATLPSVQPAGAAALPADVSPSAADAGTILVDDPTLADVDMLVDLSAIFGEESTVAEGIPAIDVPPTVSNAVEGAALTVTVPVQDAAPLAGIPFENPAPAVTLPVVQEGPVSIPGESAIPTVAAAPTPVTLPVEEAVVTLRPPRVDVGPSDLSLELRELQV